MIPEIDVQLAAIAKSLSDNVAPAVDSTNSMAQEQLHLCLATLAIVRQRLPDLHAYLRRDLADNLALARKIANERSTPETDALFAQSERVLSASAHGPHALQDQARLVKEHIAALLDAERAAPGHADAAAAILDAQPPIIQRMRAWAISMGFEPDPSQIPDLHDILNKDANG